MAQEFSRDVLRRNVAQICRTVGFDAIQTTPLDVMTHVSEKRMKSLGTQAKSYAEHFDRTEPNINDLGLSFRDFNVNIEELKEYTRCVPPMIPPVHVEQMPVSKEVNLKMLLSPNEVADEDTINNSLPQVYFEDEERVFETENTVEVLTNGIVSNISGCKKDTNKENEVCLVMEVEKVTAKPVRSPVLKTIKHPSTADIRKTALPRQLKSVLMTQDGIIIYKLVGKIATKPSIRSLFDKESHTSSKALTEKKRTKSGEKRDGSKIHKRCKSQKINRTRNMDINNLNDNDSCNIVDKRKNKQNKPSQSTEKELSLQDEHKNIVDPKDNSIRETLSSPVIKPDKKAPSLTTTENNLPHNSSIILTEKERKKSRENRVLTGAKIYKKSKIHIRDQTRNSFDNTTSLDIVENCKNEQHKPSQSIEKELSLQDKHKNANSRSDSKKIILSSPLTDKKAPVLTPIHENKSQPTFSITKPNIINDLKKINKKESPPKIEKMKNVNFKKTSKTPRLEKSKPKTEKNLHGPNDFVAAMKQDSNSISYKNEKLQKIPDNKILLYKLSPTNAVQHYDKKSARTSPEIAKDKNVGKGSKFIKKLRQHFSQPKMLKKCVVQESMSNSSESIEKRKQITRDDNNKSKLTVNPGSTVEMDFLTEFAFSAGDPSFLPDLNTFDDLSDLLEQPLYVDSFPNSFWTPSERKLSNINYEDLDNILDDGEKEANAPKSTNHQHNEISSHTITVDKKLKIVEQKMPPNNAAESKQECSMPKLNCTDLKKLEGNKLKNIKDLVSKKDNKNEKKLLIKIDAEKKLKTPKTNMNSSELSKLYVKNVSMPIIPKSIKVEQQKYSEKNVTEIHTKKKSKEVKGIKKREKKHKKAKSIIKAIEKTPDPIIVKIKLKLGTVSCNSVKPTKSCDVPESNNDKPACVGALPYSDRSQASTPLPTAYYLDDEGNKIFVCPICHKPDNGTPMIGCDGCDSWFHWVCVGVLAEPAAKDDWFCESCQVNNMLKT